MTNPLTLAGAVGIGDAAQTVNGSSQATATVMTADHVHVASVGVNAGLILKAANGGEMFSVANGDAADSLYVYPPVGAAFNGVAADLPLTLPPQRAAVFFFVSPTKINAIY